LIGAVEIIIILIAAAIVLSIGGKKISEIARELGKARVEYEKGKLEAERELQKMKKKFKEEIEEKKE
jgi:sec-independent protein translocase protein TatA